MDFVEETNVLRIYLGQNVATASVSDVVVQDGPELQCCTACTFFGPRILLLLDAACEEQERFGKVQHLKCLVAVNILTMVDISLGVDIGLIECWVGQKARRFLELGLESFSSYLGPRFP